MCQGIRPIAHIPTEEVVREIRLWSRLLNFTPIVDLQWLQDDSTNNIDISPGIMELHTDENLNSVILPPLVSVNDGDIIDV